MRGFPDLPPIWWAGSIAVIYLAKWAAPEAHVQSGLSNMVSWLVLCLALGIVAWSAFWFFRKRTPIEPHHTPKTLIVEGPYRVSRNPIYLALVLLTLASALGHGSLVGLICGAGLWRVLDKRFAEPEEALLVKTFGDAAKDYLASTRRWI